MIEVPRIFVRRRNVADDRSGVALLPISERMYARLWPIADAAKTYLSLADQEYYVTPAGSWHLNRAKRTMLWGMHAWRGAHTSPALGIAVMRSPETEYPTVGRMLVRQDALGRGLGTLSLLGLAALACERPNTLGLWACTLAANIPARTSLCRAGFVPTPSPVTRPELYGNGSGMVSVEEEWMLFLPDDVAAHREFAGVDAALINESFARYTEASKQVQVTVVPG